MGGRLLVTGGGTGGHLQPALNLMEAVRRLRPGVELHYLGARRGVESRVLPATGWSHDLLPMEPLRRSRPWRNWRLLAAAPGVAMGLRDVFRSFAPTVVLGTGGYVAGPPLIWALATGRRTAMQEQNVRPGLVTRALASRVDQLHLGFPETAGRLDPGKETAVFTHGNPVAVRGEPAKAYDWPEGRVLLVAGGSQGAASLNDRLVDDMRDVGAWPTDLSVVWIAGEDHAGRVARRVDRLPWSGRIRVEAYVPELARQLDRVDLAVSRAGAMFVSELAAQGVPAILVPFPEAAAGHQVANARPLVESGGALLREEQALQQGDLWKLATRLLADEARLDRMARAAASRGAPEAAERIAADLVRLLDDPDREVA